MSGGPLRLSPRGPAGRGLGLPGPPPRDPRKPTLAEERRHKLALRELRKAIEGKGHRLTRFRPRGRSFGWVQFAECDLQQCGLWVDVFHDTGEVTWRMRPRYRDDRDLTTGAGLAGIPECRSPMANRSSNNTAGGGTDA